MTEKRFYLMNVEDPLHEYGRFCKPVLEDGETGKQYERALELMDLLNEQHETIQKLNQQLRIFSDGLKAEIRETKEVFEDYSECVDEKKQLKEENEKLKQLLLRFYTGDEINAEMI